MPPDTMSGGIRCMPPDTHAKQWGRYKDLSGSRISRGRLCSSQRLYSSLSSLSCKAAESYKATFG
jgi:hypothetical protein